MKTIFTLLFATVVLISARAQQVSTLAGPQTGINDAIVVDSKGNIYGSYYNGAFNGSSLRKVTPEGEVTVFSDGFHCTNGSTIDENDNIYVVDVSSGYNNQIYKITPDGEKTPYGPVINGAGGLIKDPNSDTLYVGCYPDPVIGKLAPDGTYSEFISGGELNGPVGMAFDDEGNLYVANYGNGKVFKVALDGSEPTVIASIPGTSFGSVGFLTFAKGSLYATGIGKHKIYRIPLTGGFIELIGTGLSGSTDGAADSARFANPNGIALSASGDRLFVSDYTSQSIRVITDFDVEIESEPPVVDSVVVSGTSSVKVYFNERLEETSAKNKDNYVFSDNIQLNILSFSNSNNYVELHTTEMDLDNHNLELIISNILDVHNNQIVDTTIQFNKLPTSLMKKEKSSLHMFPNPVNGGVLKVNSNDEIESFELFNSRGQLVLYSGLLSSKDLDINFSGKGYGIYFLKVNYLSGKVDSYKVVN